MTATLYYEGNPNLKAAGVKVDFTPEQLEEYIKCAQDCKYFIKNYVKIVHVDHGVVAFNPYPYQERIIDSVVHNRFTLAKLARQSGKSSIIAAILLWHLLFNEHYTIAILANKETQAKDILNRYVKAAFQMLPFWLQQGVVEWNKASIKTENGSMIFAAGTSSSAIRGRTLNMLMLDEYAHVPQHIQDDFFTSVFPTISSGRTTKVIICSTPLGLEGFFYLWQGSEQGKNPFKRVESHWEEMPGRDEKWKQEQLAIMTQDKFDQEYNCEFLGSSATLISGIHLKRLIAMAENPIARSDSLRIYKQPQYGHNYLMCVDCAEGTNQDFSAFIVVDITEIPYQIVAVYQDPTIAALLYPSIILPVAHRYNDAMVLVETNGVGMQVCDILYGEFEYDGVIRTAATGRAGLTLATEFTPNSKFGMRTTQITKRIGCSHLKTLIEDQKLIGWDLALAMEFSKFTLQGKTYKAEPGQDSHDDLVMCCVFFAWIQSQKEFKDFANNDIRKHLMKEKERLLDEQTLPVGFVSEIPIRDEEVQTVPDLDKWLRDA